MSASAPATVPERRTPRVPGGTPGYWARLLPLLAAVAALTRLPSFLRPLWNPDEGFLATEARMLAHGGSLYTTVVDRKPPLLPWLYEGAFALFGDRSLEPLRAAALLAQVTAAVLLASTARRRARPAVRDRAGALAGLGYLLVSIGLAPADSQAATFEVFMVPWTVAAFWWADRAAGRGAAVRWLPAGLAVAGAALTKQTGAAVLLPLAVLLWRGEPGERRAARVRGAAWLAAGFAAPVAAVAAAVGPGGLLFWTVTGSGAYVSASGAWALAAGRGLGNAAIVLAACAGFVIPVVMRRGRAGGPEVWAWLAASALAVATGFQFYGHYYLQLLPPLVLLGTAALDAGPRPGLRAAAVWTAVASCAFLVWGLAAPRTEVRHARTVAAAIDARTAPGQPVLIWGMHPEQYWLSRRPPASRYLTAGFLTNFSGGRGGARTGERYAVPGAWRTFRRETAARPPALIVDDSRGAPYGPDRIGGLRLLLRSGYRRVGTADGAVLYARDARR